MEGITMITLQLTPEEIRSLIQSLETERDQYLKEFGSSSLIVVREVARRAAERDNGLIEKLKSVLQV
jgi:hypothetical protein